MQFKMLLLLACCACGILGCLRGSSDRVMPIPADRIKVISEVLRDNDVTSDCSEWTFVLELELKLEGKVFSESTIVCIRRLKEKVIVHIYDGTYLPSACEEVLSYSITANGHLRLQIPINLPVEIVLNGECFLGKWGYATPDM